MFLNLLQELGSNPFTKNEQLGLYYSFKYHIEVNKDTDLSVKTPSDVEV